MSIRRRQPDRKQPKPTVIVASGELSTEDRTLIAQILGRFGLTVKTMTPEEYAARTMVTANVQLVDDFIHRSGKSYDFKTITEPDQFLVREHLEHLGRHHPALNSMALRGQIFNRFVDEHGNRDHIFDWDETRDPSTRDYRDPEPMDGIDIMPRTELGTVHPTPEISLNRGSKSYLCARFAIRAGSIVDTVAHAEWSSMPDVSMVEQGAVAIANILNSQFK